MCTCPAPALLPKLTHLNFSRDPLLRAGDHFGLIESQTNSIVVMFDLLSASWVTRSSHLAASSPTGRFELPCQLPRWFASKWNSNSSLGNILILWPTQIPCKRGSVFSMAGYAADEVWTRALGLRVKGWQWFHRSHIASARRTLNCDERS